MRNDKELDELRVVLVSTRNPLNIGAAARAMANFGVQRLRLVKPYGPGFREARSARGAAGLLREAEVFSEVAEAVADCSLVIGTTAARDRVPQVPMKTLQEASEEIRASVRSGPVAILFGSEKRGLSNEDLSHCQLIVRIPTRDLQPSMNLGQAVAVCLYELTREGGKRGRKKRETTAKAKELERFMDVLFSALQSSGYVKRGAEDATRENVRRMVRRLNLPSDDVDLWLGMLRKMLWKIRVRSD